MSLESFISLDQGEGGSEQALEALREKMRAAAAQIAAIQKEEGKQKKKEDELLKILLKFIKTSQKKELVLLISRVLEQNIPANFILAIILLGNEDIQKEVGRYLMLKPGENGHADRSKSAEAERSLVFFSEKDSSLPLKIKIELDSWLKDMLFQAGENPQKLLRTAYKIEMVEKEKENEWDDPKYEEIKTPSPAVIHLMTFVMQDFLSQEKIEEQHEKLYEFAEFMYTGILSKTEETFLNRKLLRNTER